jgi:hypothetical protein
MKRVIIITLGLVVSLAAPVLRAQTTPDFSGTWKLNAAKSGDVAGNGPSIAFPSQLEVKQSGMDLYVSATSVRQAPFTATYKLDGSTVKVQAPVGITETAQAKLEGASVVITTRRSFTSPAGETVINFKERWTVNGNMLTVEKTRVEESDSLSEKGVYDKG